MVCEIPFICESIDLEGCHIFIEVKINDKTALMLLDTGASRTVFDIRKIKHYIGRSKKNFSPIEGTTTGLGTSTLKAQVANLNIFELDKIQIRNFAAILIDMIHVNKSYKIIGLPEIAGVIGSDIFLEYKAVIDYDKKNIKLKTN